MKVVAGSRPQALLAVSAGMAGGVARRTTRENLPPTCMKTMTLPPVLIDVAESFETRRLRARVPRHGDGAIFHEALVETLLDLRRFVGSLSWVAAEPTIDVAEAFCRNAFGNFHSRRDLPYLVFEKESDRFIGVCGMHRPEWAVPKVELGFWCRKSAQGNGFIGEAVRAITDLAINDLKAQRVEMSIDEFNQPSRRVAELCGFELEGIMKNCRRGEDGSLRNTCIYARTRALAPLA